MFDVFISYARNEYDRAIIIKEFLEGLSLRVYLDVDGIDGGDVFPDILDKAVKSSGAILGVWSPYSLTRPWVRTECLIGKDRGVLIPVVIEPIPPMDMPAAFYGLQVVDLSADLHDPESRAYKALARSLARTLKRPDLMPAPPVRERPRPKPAEPRVSNAGVDRAATSVARKARSIEIEPWLTRALWAVPLVLLSGISWSNYGDLRVLADPILFAPLLVLWAATAAGDTRHRSIALAAASLCLAIRWDLSDDWQFGGSAGLAVALAMMALNMRATWMPSSSATLAIAGAVVIALSNWFRFNVAPFDVLYVDLFSHSWVIVGLGLLAVSGLPALRAAGLALSAFVIGALPRLLALDMPRLESEIFTLDFRAGAPDELAFIGIPIVAVLIGVALGAFRADTITAKVAVGLGWLWVAVSIVAPNLPDGVLAALSGPAWAQAPVEPVPETIIVTGTIRDWNLPFWLMIPAVGVATGAALPNRFILSAAASVVLLLLSTFIALRLEQETLSIFEFIAAPLAIWLGATRARLPQLAV